MKGDPCSNLTKRCFERCFPVSPVVELGCPPAGGAWFSTSRFYLCQRQTDPPVGSCCCCCPDSSAGFWLRSRWRFPTWQRGCERSQKLLLISPGSPSPESSKPSPGCRSRWPGAPGRWGVPEAPPPGRLRPHPRPPQLWTNRTV